MSHLGNDSLHPRSEGRVLSPHPKMAQLALSRSAVDDIAAYIASLKK
jgi:hypothetical protein